MSLSSRLYLVFCQSFILLLLVSCGSGGKETARDSYKENIQIALITGIQQYKARDYDHALMSLRKVVDHKKTALRDKIEAHKLRAFIYALQEKTKASHDEFRKAFDLDPDFTLDKAEVGNPFWMPPYETARTETGLLKASPGELADQAINAYLKHDYAVALDRFSAALKRKDLGVRDKISCYKYIAFIHALHNRPRETKQAFRNAFQLDRRFTLEKGEYGNPSWTPIYDEVLKEMKK